MLREGFPQHVVLVSSFTGVVDKNLWLRTPRQYVSGFVSGREWVSITSTAAWLSVTGRSSQLELLSLNMQCFVSCCPCCTSGRETGNF